jgi:3'(2'), 5'-bisphosphate nucleotidase
MTTGFPSIQSIVDIAREAGDLVLSMQKDVMRKPELRHIKPDGSPVTDADIKSLEFIVKKLRALTPNIPIVAEEQSADVNKTILKDKNAFWLVDSLDNTPDYSIGGHNFSINIAWINEHGHSKLGVLNFPGLSELYYTGDDGKAYKQTKDEPPELIQVLGFDAAANAKTIKIAQHPTRPAEVGSFLDKPMRFITSRGQRRACLVATGEVALCVETEGFYIWDTAPIAAILFAAGGGVFNLQDSEPLFFNKELQLPGYAASATREIPEKMGLFGVQHPLLRKSGNA